MDHKLAKNGNDKPHTDVESTEKCEVDKTCVYKIGSGPKGRGLFAVQDIPSRTLIHVAPCIRIDRDEYDKYMRYTILEHYLFNADGGDKFLALGFGSLFNHSSRPNVDYRVDTQQSCIRYFCGHKPIPMGEELCIYYGNHVWFDDASDGANSDKDEEDGTDDDDDGSENGLANFLHRLEL